MRCICLRRGILSRKDEQRINRNSKDKARCRIQSEEIINVEEEPSLLFLCLIIALAANWLYQAHKKTGGAEDPRFPGGSNYRVTAYCATSVPSTFAVLLASFRCRSLSFRTAERFFSARRTLFIKSNLKEYAINATLHTGGYSHFSMTDPITSGWSGCRVEFSHTEKRRLNTAHANKGPSIPYENG